MRKACESELFDFEDNFQIEVVDGESLYVCNVCNEGLENKQEIEQHIKNNPESLLNDDSFDDIGLYEGFDKEGHRIVLISVYQDLVYLNCAATCLDTVRGRHSAF